MSFNNGYNIKDYLGRTIEKYNNDNNIFNKAISSLNIFMQRSDWPMCYYEYEESVSDLIGSAEGICRDIGMFLSQDPELNPNVKDWDKELDEAFYKDIKYFFNVVNPIINSYYNYINNPLGINRIVQIDNYSSRKLLRIKRIDGEVFDLRLTNDDLKQLSETLSNMAKEDSSY